MPWSKSDLEQFSPSELAEIALWTANIDADLRYLMAESNGGPIRLEVAFTGVSGKAIWEGVADQFARNGWHVATGFHWATAPDCEGICYLLAISSETIDDAKTQAKVEARPGGMAGSPGG